ncbi:MAG: CAP domain-containing protein [Legionellales bacterium]|nr:CAP domain-containing protein [Legionellales bacterium]
MKRYVQIVVLMMLPLTLEAATFDRQQQQILQEVNTYRVKHHLKPLVLDPSLSKEATLHSQHMAQKTTSFGHAGFQGRIKRLYRHHKECQGGAENVAYYRLLPTSLVREWIASRGHRINIEGPYTLTGIGIAPANKKGWAYFTQIFLRCSR